MHSWFCRFAVSFTAALLGLGGTSLAKSRPPDRARPIVSWQTMTSFAAEALKHAPNHQVNTLILEFQPNPDQPGREWDTFLDDLAFDDFAPKVAKKGEARRNVEKLRANISGLIDKAQSRNIEVYLVTTEFSFPPGMLKAYPQAADVNSEFIWRFLESRLEEVLRALPGAAGIVLYTDEPSDFTVYELEGIDHVAALRRLLDVYHGVCRRNGRRFVVTTFLNYDAGKMKILLSTLEHIPPAEDFWVDSYVCPGDWGLIRLVNPAISKVGRHTQFLTFDFTGEVWGQANIPLCEARLLHDRLKEVREVGVKIAGINGYVSWYTQSIFGTPSVINIDLAPELLRDSDQDPETLVHEWLRKRYGQQAADRLTAAFLNSFDVADKAIQTLGFWVSEAPKSAFPPPAWIGFSLRTESLAVWDPSFRSLEDKLARPSPSILARVIEEKDSSVSLAIGAVRAVEESKPYLQSSDYEQLHRQFSLAVYVARAYRLYLEMYLRFRMWDQGGRGPIPEELGQLRKSIQELGVKMGRSFGSPPVFCPKSLLDCLAKLDGYLNGQSFFEYPPLTGANATQYPPVDWAICAPQ